MSMMRFDGKVALVTGGGRGMGRTHCLLLAERGAKVVVNDLGVSMGGGDVGETPAEAVVAEIIRNGGQAIVDGHDVASPEGAQAMVDAAVNAWDRIDIVVHNAGIVRFAPFGQMSYEDFRSVVSVHLDGGFLVSRAAWPHMAAQQSGRIVFIVSQAALSGLDNNANYGAAKTGLVGLARGMAIDGAADGIKVNCVDVTALTRMMEGFFTGPDDVVPSIGTQADALDWWKRYVTPELISPVIAYLAHDECAFSGEIVNTVGGRVCNQYLAMTDGISDPNLSMESIRDRLPQIFSRGPNANAFSHTNEYLGFQLARLAEETGIPQMPGS
jgi:NAD(P)-dependent dehydrogenase (short-subunit alcohol dehydrogenase family)